MDFKKLSIIIPLYNAEAVVERTLKSIFASNLPREFYDIIVVDDGSTDNSLAVVKGLAEAWPNLQVLSQENGGSSKARNSGLKEATSDYIWFIDADDKVEKNLTCIQQLIEEHPKVDLFSFAFNWMGEHGQHLGYGQMQEKVAHDVELSGRAAILQGYQPGSVCGLIIRRAFLVDNSLEFKEGITQQDVELTYRMFARAGMVYFSSAVIYNYLFCPTSITRSPNVKKRMKYELDKIEIIKSFRQQAAIFQDADPELSAQMMRYADSTLFGYVYYLFKNKRSLRKMGISEAALRTLKADGFYPLRLEGLGWKKKIVCKILNIEKLLR